MVPNEIAATPHWLVKPYFRLSQLAKERENDGAGGPTYKEKRKKELKELADKHGLSMKWVFSFFVQNFFHSKVR